MEGGRIVHPVHEVTIAGNLKQMFQDIVAVGADEYTLGGKTLGSVLAGAHEGGRLLNAPHARGCRG